MSAPSLAAVLSILMVGGAMVGCAGGLDATPGPNPVVAGGNQEQDTETRAERYARGEYRRGFGRDSEKQMEFCRLHPADTDCIGRRF